MQLNFFETLTDTRMSATLYTAVSKKFKVVLQKRKCVRNMPKGIVGSVSFPLFHGTSRPCAFYGFSFLLYETP